jgi:hypothetical protein
VQLCLLVPFQWRRLLPQLLQLARQQHRQLVKPWVNRAGQDQGSLVDLLELLRTLIKLRNC